MNTIKVIETAEQMVYEDRNRTLKMMQLILDRMSEEVYDSNDLYRSGYATAIKDMARVMGEDPMLYGLETE